MEAAGVVIGIIPLLVGAIKSYRATCEKLKTFRDISREVRRIQCRLRNEKIVFENECCLLLNIILNDEHGGQRLLDTHSSVEDLRHSSVYNGQAISEEKVRRRLGDTYDGCKELIEDILDDLNDIQKDIDRLTPVQHRDQTSANWKHGAKAVRNAVVAAFEKNQYMRRIEALRDLRETLTLFRQQIDAMLLPRRSRSVKKVKKFAIPRHFERVRNASSTLHAALLHAWSHACPEAAHLQHKSLLCLDAQAEESVRLDLAVSYVEKERALNSEFSIGESPVWLYVRSLTTNSENESSHARSLCDSSYPSEISEDDTERTLAEISPEANEEQKFAFSNKDHKDVPIGRYDLARSGNPEGLGMDACLTDLVHCNNICERLQRSGCGIGSEGNYLGYLMSTTTFQHFLYATSEGRQSAGNARGSPVTLQNFLQSATEESLVIMDQLQLAYKLAVAMLQYRSTPWLHERWGLRDISIFQRSEVDNETAFRTLHFSACFPRQTPVEGDLNTDSLTLESSDHMEPVPVSPRNVIEEGNSIEASQPADHLLYGIDNMTLSSLGIALLEIGHRKPLKVMRKASDPNDIYTARRLAVYAVPPLGESYQDIVKKCLRCDFGLGNDLSSMKLQSAVFSEVVCELRRLIET